MRKRAKEKTISVHKIYDDALQEIFQESGSEGIVSQLPSLYSCEVKPLLSQKRTPNANAKYSL